MIKKFQQGGQADQAIMQFVQGIAQELQADPQQVVQAAQQNPEALKAAVQVFQKTQDIKQAAQTFAQAVQQKTQAAKHGTKLNYIKSLKHQCAEGEELYYFKKGGSVGCGCRKKEDGGKVQSAKPGAVAKFKKDREVSKKPNPYAPESEQKFLALRDKDRLAQANKELQKEKENQAKNRKAFEQAGKDDGWYVANNGDAYPPHERGRKPVVKKSCGSKLKKHFNGGSLNRIPFYQNGTNKGGIVIIEDPKQAAAEINTTNRNTAKGLFKGITSGTILPTIPNIGRMVSSAYKGWIDPETGLNTGVAPLPGFTKLGTPVKIVNGVKYYKDTAGNLKTAQQILKAKGLKTVVKAPKPSWISPKNHAADYVPKNATGIYNELEKEAQRGIELMKDPFFDWRDIDYINKDLYYKKGGKI